MMKSIQKRVDDWVKEYGGGYYFTPYEALARLMEEVGELAREVNHRWGAKKKKSTEELMEIEDELADIIFTLVCTANPLNIDLDKAFDKMMEKYTSRDATRWGKKKKEGR